MIFLWAVLFSITRPFPASKTSKRSAVQWLGNSSAPFFGLSIMSVLPIFT